jgi:hypothetical protein
MGLAEPPGRAAGGTAPVIVVGLDGSPASRRRLRDPCAVETERPPAPGPVFVVPPGLWCRPLASRLGMPLVTLDAERRARAQHNGSGPPIRAESDDLAVSAAPTVNDRPAPIRQGGAIWDPCRTNRCLRLVTAVRAALHTSNDSAATPGEQASAWAWAQFWAHSPPSATVHRCSLRSCSRSWRTAADAGERHATVLESVLGATPQEFESPILRHL